jgi:hypothetical protein
MWSNGYAARALPELFVMNGMRDIRTEPAVIPLTFAEVDFLTRNCAIYVAAMGGISQAELTLWLRSLLAAEAGGYFYASVNSVICAGIR